MKAVFYGNRQGNWMDKAVRWYTSPFTEKLNGKWKDGYSHVELEFSDGMMFSSSPRDNATRFTKRNPVSTAWVEVALDMDSYDEKLIRQFCENREGLKYDYAGVAGFVFGNPDLGSRWFCSEICVAALQRVDVLKWTDPSKISPNGMYSLLSEIA